MREYLQGLHVWHNGENTPEGCSKRPGSSHVVCLVDLVCFVYLVDLVHLVSFVQPNKRDRPNKPNNGLLTLADFFSILSEKMPQDIAKRCQSWYNSDPVPQ